MMEILVKMMKRETANKDQGAVPLKKEPVFQSQNTHVSGKEVKCIYAGKFKFSNKDY